MKVLFAINKLGIGGAETVTIHQANLIDKNKFEVYFGIMYATNQKNTLYHKLYIPENNIIHFNFSHLFDLKAFVRTYHFLKDKKIDIVSTGLFEANTAVRFAALFAGVPVIVATEHSRYHNKNLWQKIIDWFLSIFTDRIFAVSSEIALYTSKQEHIPSEKFTVLNQITDLSTQGLLTSEKIRSELVIPNNAFVAMTVGRFSPEKAQYRIIDIAESIVVGQNITDVYFLIVGYGPLEDELRKIVSDKKLEKYVKVVADPKQAKEYLIAGDIFLLTSDREGMPVAMLEAMYNGLPCIATRVGGVKDVLKDGEGGFIVEPLQISEMSKKVLWLKSHEKEREKMKMIAKQIAIKNNGDIRELENILEGLYVNKYSNK